MGNCLKKENNDNTSQEPIIAAVGKPNMMDRKNPTFVLGKKTGDIKDKYTLGEVLGEGQFGKARKCTSKATNQTYACKTVSKRKLHHEEDVEDLRREVQIMNHLAGHPSIVKIFDTFEDSKDVHIVMEICSGGELFERIIQEKKYSEKKAADMCRTIVEAVTHMHQMGVMHRDLKPENFLLDSPGQDANLKFTDFGLSVFFKPGDTFSDTVGSAYYIAPEVLGQKKFDPKTGRKVKCDPKYDEKADIWSCGVILYILLSGVPPFWGDTQEAIFREVIKGELDLQTHPWPSISSDAKNCIRRMLTRDVDKRPSGEEMLADPWLKKGGNASDKIIDNVVASRLKNFSQMNKLKKKALQVIAASLDPAEIEGLKNMFETIDADKNGTITMDELRAAIGKGQYKLTEEDITSLMEAADVDGNGEIDYNEFLAATLHQSKLDKEEHIYEAFKKFDADGNGVLSLEEITDALKTFNMAEGEIAAILKEVDKDGNGEVDYEEFLVMMRDSDMQKAPTRRGAPQAYY